MRVLFMFTTEDRKGVQMLYAAAHFAAREVNDPNIGEYVEHDIAVLQSPLYHDLMLYTALSFIRSIKLLVDCENIQRLFIDEFFPHMEFIGPAMLLLHESLTVLDNCENLRSKYVLNPTSEGEAMSLPARMMVCTCALQPPCLESCCALFQDHPTPAPTLATTHFSIACLTCCM